MSFTLKIKKLADFPDDYIPSYATPGSAGLDLHAYLTEALTIEPGKVSLIPTGIALEIPREDIVGLIYARSGIASKNLINLANGVGVIDSDYTGEIKIPLMNCGEAKYIVNPGDRIAQIVFQPILKATIEIVEDLKNTSRGEKGFGSTGK